MGKKIYKNEMVKYIEICKDVKNKIVLNMNGKEDEEEVLKSLYNLQEIITKFILKYNNIDKINIDSNAIECNKFNDCLDSVLKFYKINL